REAIGCFLNTVVLRSSVDEDMPFRELLRGVRRTVSEAIEHRDVPFELVLDALEVERSASHPPLVQVLFQFDHPIPLPPESLFATLHETYLGASLPISLICGAGGDDIEIELHHDMGGAAGDAIGRLPESMLKLLRVLVEDGASEAPLAETLAVLGPTEQPWTDATSFDHVSDGGAGVNGQDVVGDDVLAQVLTEFQSVLRVENLTASAAFFEHGGDSLAALELAEHLSEAFDVNVKVLDIFEAETPAGVAARLTTLGAVR
ncbi:phosphopantetheine-binding protein, partial [Cribrihabitans neustonicus]|uniref:acyl carrier protein n=1 Tax=Cribrihabitans neustonicus TaxID=1429085 RepID=UPI003B58CCBA